MASDNKYGEHGVRALSLRQQRHSTRPHAWFTASKAMGVNGPAVHALPRGAASVANEIHEESMSVFAHIFDHRIEGAKHRHLAAVKKPDTVVYDPHGYPVHLL